MWWGSFYFNASDIMKNRHTFFIDETRQQHPPQDCFRLIEGKKGELSTLQIRHLQAAREWKITIGPQDLNNTKVREFKKGKITVQLVKEASKNVPEPLQQGFVQGMHIFWKEPRLNASTLPIIGRHLPISSPAPITLPGGVFYLHLQQLSQSTIDSLYETFWSLFNSRVDPLQLAPLVHADVLDFEITSPFTLAIRGIWAAAPRKEGWHIDIPEGGDRTEAGIFNEGIGEDKDEYALSGVRVVVGVDTEFQPAVFTFPHRHHILSKHVLQTSLSPPYGSHPILQTILPPSALRPPVNDTLNHETCNFYALYTLSKEVFVDKYQLAQLAQFSSGGLQNVQGIWGETDLEDPSYKTKGWGSIVLINVTRTNPKSTLELPIHLRYLGPQDGGGYRNTEVLPPQLFWACQNDAESTTSTPFLLTLDFAVSPFNPSSQSVLHSLFSSDTVFYHIPGHDTHDSYSQGKHSKGVVSINVPVADVSQAILVKSLTIFGILIGFTYLFVKSLRAGIKGLRWRAKGKEKAKEL